MNKEKLIYKEKHGNIEVISLGKEHLDACVKLDLLALKGLWSKKQWAIELTDNKRICLGAITKSKFYAVASGWIISNELHIMIVAVHPLFRRKGLGKLVVSSLVREAELLGIKRITLEVKESNEPAKEMYKSLGFKIYGKRNNFYKDGSDALILWFN